MINKFLYNKKTINEIRDCFKTAKSSKRNKIINYVIENRSFADLYRFIDMCNLYSWSIFTDEEEELITKHFVYYDDNNWDKGRGIYIKSFLKRMRHRLKPDDMTHLINLLLTKEEDMTLIADLIHECPEIFDNYDFNTLAPDKLYKKMMKDPHDYVISSFLILNDKYNFFQKEEYDELFSKFMSVTRYDRLKYFFKRKILTKEEETKIVDKIIEIDSDGEYAYDTVTSFHSINCDNMSKLIDEIIKKENNNYHNIDDCVNNCCVRDYFKFHPEFAKKELKKITNYIINTDDIKRIYNYATSAIDLPEDCSKMLTDKIISYDNVSFIYEYATNRCTLTKDEINKLLDAIISSDDKYKIYSYAIYLDEMNINHMNVKSLANKNVKYYNPNDDEKNFNKYKNELLSKVIDALINSCDIYFIEDFLLRTTSITKEQKEKLISVIIKSKDKARIVNVLLHFNDITLIENIFGDISKFIELCDYYNMDSSKIKKQYKNYNLLKFADDSVDNYIKNNQKNLSKHENN